VKKRMSMVSIATAALAFATAMASYAGEVSTGNLTLYKTRMRTVGAPGEVIALPACPNQVKAFTDLTIPCPTGGCTIEINVSSELSDVSGSQDSVRFYAYVDGSNILNPSINAGVQSTAHAGQIETATMSWMKNNLVSGNHIVAVQFCVADTDGGGASAFAGDRTLTVHSYTGN